jgi:putative heme transporter
VLVASALARSGSVRRGYRAGWLAFAWALVNWAADVACLACAIEAARAPVPWRVLLLIWSAGAGAASFCPVPAGLGVVDIVLITALAAAGLSAPHAVTAVLIYRVITFKILVTIAWLSYHHLAERRSAGEVARSRPSMLPADNRGAPGVRR